MRVLGKKKINNFCEKHTDAREQLLAWVAELEDADWSTPVDLKDRYPSASILSGKQVVFDIKGNNYRIHALIDFQSGIVVCKQIGTHAEYDKWGLG